MKIYLKYSSKLGLICGLILLQISCYKDKGNYDYQPQNILAIAGIDSSYSILAGNVLTINPTITTGDKSDSADTTRFNYKWVKELPSGQVLTLSDKPNLSIEITADRFTFNQVNPIYFVVIDKQTAARSQFMLRLDVQTQTSFTKKGWYILSDINNGSKLGLIAYANNEQHYYDDVLQTIGSGLRLEEQGAPLGLSIDLNAMLTVSTEQTSAYLPVLDGLDWKSDYLTRNLFIASPPANMQISYAGPLDVQTRETNIVYADHNYYIESPQYEDFFGSPINQYDLSPQPFRASPYFGAFWQERGTLMWDLDKKQFALYRLSFSASSAQPLLSLAIEGGTTVNLPTDKELRHMAKVRYTGERGQVFAILKASNNVYSLLRFEGRIGTRTTIVLKEAESEIKATDFHLAEHITYHPVYGYIYYNVGSRIYAYDPIGTKTSKLMLDVGEDKISMLEFSISNNTAYRQHPEELSKLAVGTYNDKLPKDKSGKLSFYQVPSAMAPITQSGKSYSGMGVIKQVAFVTN